MYSVSLNSIQNAFEYLHHLQCKIAQHTTFNWIQLISIFKTQHNKVGFSMGIQINEIIPEFSLPSTNGLISREDFFGKKTILFFYPRDNTPGCTRENLDFKEYFEKFTEAQFQLYGVSRDSIESHESFRKKHELPFHLISDSEGILCTAFDLLKMKNLYGRSYLGIERSSLLISPDCQLIQCWRNVKVPGHVQNLLSEVLKTKDS